MLQHGAAWQQTCNVHGRLRSILYQARRHWRNLKRRRGLSRLLCQLPCETFTLHSGTAFEAFCCYMNACSLLKILKERKPSFWSSNCSNATLITHLLPLAAMKWIEMASLEKNFRLFRHDMNFIGPKIQKIHVFRQSSPKSELTGSLDVVKHFRIDYI